MFLLSSLLPFPLSLCLLYAFPTCHLSYGISRSLLNRCMMQSQGEIQPHTIASETNCSAHQVIHSTRLFCLLFSFLSFLFLFIFPGHRFSLYSLRFETALAHVTAVAEDKCYHCTMYFPSLTPHSLLFFLYYLLNSDHIFFGFIYHISRWMPI